jgi:hypothetical protein
VRRHELDVVSLVFGLLFAMVALLWPLWRLDVLDDSSLSWLPALALVVIGVLGVTLSIMRSRRQAEELRQPTDELPLPAENDDQPVLD